MSDDAKTITAIVLITSMVVQALAIPTFLTLGVFLWDVKLIVMALVSMVWLGVTYLLAGLLAEAMG